MKEKSWKTCSDIFDCRKILLTRLTLSFIISMEWFGLGGFRWLHRKTRLLPPLIKFGPIAVASHWSRACTVLGTWSLPLLLLDECLRCFNCLHWHLGLYTFNLLCFDQNCQSQSQLKLSWTEVAVFLAVFLFPPQYAILYPSPYCHSQYGPG